MKYAYSYRTNNGHIVGDNGECLCGMQLGPRKQITDDVSKFAEVCWDCLDTMRANRELVTLTAVDSFKHLPWATWTPPEESVWTR